MWRVRLMLATALVFAAGCSSDPDNGGKQETDIRLAFEASDGSPVTGFVALASFGGEAVSERIACGDVAAQVYEATSHLECDGLELRLKAPAETMKLMIKATNVWYQTIQIAPATEPGLRKVVLKSLPEPQVNDDFATYLSAEDGVETLKRLAFPSDTELGKAYALKFYIDSLDSQPMVYFQNTKKYALHWDFARIALKKNLTRQEFDNQTYYGDDRIAMAGTIVWYPFAQGDSASANGTILSPICVTFFPSDGLSPEMALRAHRLIEQRLGFAALDGIESRVFYLPAGEVQEAQLLKDTANFSSSDSLWIVRKELYGDVTLQILNPGLAYGTLRLVTPEDLDTKPVSFKDILVLTRLPNDLPIVGGTITEELQTPLAHVNVMARTRGTPNIALLQASDDQRVAPFLDQLVRFEVRDGTFTLREASLDEAEEYWQSLAKEPFVPSSDLTVQNLPLLAELQFSDSTSVGVKAANVAELTRAVAANAPNGFAVPFYHYDHFMNTSLLTTELCTASEEDCLSEGRNSAACGKARQFCDTGAAAGENLQQTAQRLVDDGEIKADSVYRDAALNMLRYAIRNTPVDPLFASSLDLRVAQVFGGTRCRLRSSTNAEDLENFSGAGLYESAGAFASGEDAASLEIGKIWSSVWNWKAYEERTFWNIDHMATKMAVLVSTAYPDEEANGVLITQNIADPTVYGMYANVQLGEVPVTNPQDGAIPEIFTIIPAPGSGVQVSRQRLSSLSPNAPIMSDKEISDLYYAGFKVRWHFSKLYEVDFSTLAMDIEFKIYGEDRKLIIKQARPYSVGSYVP